MMDEPVVVVNGYEAIREVTHGNDFADRVGSGMYSIEKYNPKLFGLINADYTETYHLHRRFMLSSLRRFGFGKASFEGIITREVNALLTHINGLPKVPHDLGLTLMMSVCSTLCDTILDCHYDHSDPKFQRFVHMDAMLKKFGETEMFLMNFFPITRPFFQRQVVEMRAIADELDAFTMGKVASRWESFVAGKEPGDFLDCYLENMTEEPEVYNKEELRYVLSELFMAASDTSANTLNFAILYMMVNLDIQEKVHEELIRVVGPSRLPTLEDRDKLPYTVATIHETQRLGNVVAVLPRCATVDTMLAGYSIPKGTRIACDLWALHYDPKLWPEPERFDPLRYISDNGKVVKSPHLLPFGAGRRGCIGESFARMQLFLFFSSLMHQFKFQVPPGMTNPSLEHQPGWTAAPKPFKVMITRCAAEIPA